MFDQSGKALDRLIRCLEIRLKWVSIDGIYVISCLSYFNCVIAPPSCYSDISISIVYYRFHYFISLVLRVEAGSIRFSLCLAITPPTLTMRLLNTLNLNVE